MNFIKKYAFVGLLLMQVVLISVNVVDGRPIPGRKKAFGGGLLAGALAGGVLGNVLTRQHQANQAQQNSNSNAAPVTSISNGPVLSNGCYQQTISEPDPMDPEKYIRTVRLICPPGVQPGASQFQPQPAAAPVAPAAVAPAAQPAQPALPPLPVSVINFAPQPEVYIPPNVAVEPSTNPAQSNNQAPFDVAQIPIGFMQPAPPQPGPAAAAQVPTHAPAQSYPMPAAPAVNTRNEVPQESQVIVISQKTGYYNKKSKSGCNAPSMNSLALSMAIIFVMFAV